MKDKPIKQPWPRSAKITVWVLGIIIAASAIVNIIAVGRWYGPYQEWLVDKNSYLPRVAPPEVNHSAGSIPDRDAIRHIADY